jgi:hypothetical protein
MSIYGFLGLLKVVKYIFSRCHELSFSRIGFAKFLSVGSVVLLILNFFCITLLMSTPTDVR